MMACTKCEIAQQIAAGGSCCTALECCTKGTAFPPSGADSHFWSLRHTEMIYKLFWDLLHSITSQTCFTAINVYFMD